MIKAKPVSRAKDKPMPSGATSSGSQKRVLADDEKEDEMEAEIDQQVVQGLQTQITALQDKLMEVTKNIEK